MLELVAEDRVTPGRHALDEVHAIELTGHRRIRGEDGARVAFGEAADEAGAVVRLAPVALAMEADGPAEVPRRAVGGEDHVRADAVIGFLLLGQCPWRRRRDAGPLDRAERRPWLARLEPFLLEL